MTKMRIYGPPSWHDRHKNLEPTPPLRRGGKIRSRRLHMCRICFPWKCRGHAKPPQPSKRTPVGKRRDKRGQGKPR